MKSFVAFLKKEFLEITRSGKLMMLGIMFVVLGIMNPAIAKLTPWLFEILSDELATNGMIITEVSVDALTSWTQFFKNIPIALIVCVLLFSSSFTKEYESNTLILVITKGLARYKVLLSKAAVMLLIWSVGYWLCFGITYLYNSYFWDNSIALGLFPATFDWWLFGVFAISIIVLFSVISKSYIGVLLGVGGSVLILYLLGLFPVFSNFTPTALLNSYNITVGLESASEYVKSIIVASAISVVSIAVSIPLFNKKQL